MSSAAEEIELLERVLLRLGCAETDEKLETVVHKFLTPVILKITSPHENVKSKVVEVLTHVKRRLTSRPLVRIPVDALLDQYKTAGNVTILQNFVIIFITMGFPRLTLEERYSLLPKIVACEEKPGATQDKFFMMVLPLLEEIKLPDDRKTVLQIEDKPVLRRNLLALMQDVLLLPYGLVKQSENDPPTGGMSVYSMKRVLANGWSAEELEKVKKGIVRFIISGVFTDAEIFTILVLASSDTRFSVATPAISELNKVCNSLDFADPHNTFPLYNLFCGNNAAEADKKTSPCSARVRQKLLQYLIKCRGNGINVPKGIQVIFEGLFGENTNQKCKILALKFTEILVKDGSKEIVSKVAKVILTGLTKIIGKESDEPVDAQNAAYQAMAQLARSYPSVINADLKLVLSYFNHLASAPVELQGSIREALISMAPAFAFKAQPDAMDDSIELSGQQHLLLAMLSDNAESPVHIVHNVTSIFLTTCYPEYFPAARCLLLLIAGERTSLHENIMTMLYGASRKDHINYAMLRSIECADEADAGDSSPEGKVITLPSFRAMMQHVNEMSGKRLAKKAVVVVGNKTLPFSLNAYEEILEYLRLCLWYSAGAKCQPGEEKYAYKLKQYIEDNYENGENNEIFQYVRFVQNSVEAKRSDTNLQCLYDLLNAAPELLIKDRLHLLEPLSHTLKDVSETMRQNVAQVYGILLAYGYEDAEFDKQIKECLESLNNRSLENKHGWLLVLGHTFSRKINFYLETGKQKDFGKWSEFVESIKVIVKMLCESQWLMVAGAVKCISMIGKLIEIPHVEVEIQIPTKKDDGDEDETMEYETATASTKSIIFSFIFHLVRNTSVRAKIRQESARCLGFLAIGDGDYFTQRNLQKFLSMVKVQKDAALNIAISDALVSTLNGYDVNSAPRTKDFQNKHCDDKAFEAFLNSLVRLVLEPNPHCRQAISVWLLGVVKHCSHRAGVLNSKQTLQFAFTELLSDDSEFVQDVASRGLGLVYGLSDPNDQNDLANSLLDQLIGGQRKVKKVDGDSELFAEGMLGKTPTGGNITTYKELCSLASDLNQPEMIYQFMQLANHNAAWTSKLGAAFGLKSLSKESKEKMQPYLGKIIPRLYRYKYDPTPKIQNSMISIWDSIVSDPKEVVELYYWEILREILNNLTFNEWRVRIACCLAVRDLLKRPSGLRLRTDDAAKKALKGEAAKAHEAMDTDSVPEPELHELWSQLFRVMDDIHEGTRIAAQGSAMFLSKLCVVASSSDQGKSGVAVASSILPLLLEVGVTHTVAEIRKVSIKTISDMIDSSGALIAPHLPTLIPCLLKATGELESTKLSYLSTRLGSDNDAQEAVDSLRAEAAKSHHTMETISKCVNYLDYEALEKMTPAVLELTKTSLNLGTKISCAHFICLISVRLGKVMTPLTSKYLGACFVGLKDRNATVRKYYASAIGHLVGIAKEQSVKNLFTKLCETYLENSSNRAVALTIQSINKRQNELLRDYMECVLPLIFFAMHEEPNEDNKSNIEVWKDLWHEICTGDAGIRMNLNVIVPQLEASLAESSWSRKAQAGNAINTIAVRLGNALEHKDRLHLINLLLSSLQGRTFQGKERLLQALASLCKGLGSEHEVCPQIIEAAMRECRKEEPKYRTLVLGSLGVILEELEADRFEEVYKMVWHLLEERKLRNSDDESSDHEKDLSADERNKRAQLLNKLKETVCETLGKAWPKNAIDTQYKYQLKFAERCAECLKNNTRPVQVSLLGALTKFVERLRVFDNPAMASPEVKEKRAKVEESKESRDTLIVRICSDILSAVAYASEMPHTGLKKECLNILLMLTKRMTDSNDTKHLVLVKDVFEKCLPKFQKDSAPEIRCRIKDMEEKLTKYNV